VDIGVEVFRNLRDLRVGVPFQEAGISWKEIDMPVVKQRLHILTFETKELLGKFEVRQCTRKRRNHRYLPELIQ
jgi:hypothetical protein